MKSLNWICLYLIFLLPILGIGQENIHQKASLLLEKGDYEKAVELLKPHLETKEDDLEARLLYGRGLIKTGEHEKAIAQLKTLKKAFAERADFHFWLGQAYLGKLNASKNFFEKGIIASKVKEAFEKAVELDPEDLTARNSLAQYYLSAPAIAGGSTKKAKEQIDFIKSRNPRMGYNAMATYYFQKKEYELARKEYLQYLEIAEDKSEVLYLIGFAHQLEKNYDAAFDYFNKSMEADSNYLASYYQYGRTAVFSKKNIAAGIELMTIYIEKGGLDNGPDIPSAYWRLGLLYELQQAPKQARQMYEKALQINPAHPQAKEALEKMN